METTATSLSAAINQALMSNPGKIIPAKWEVFKMSERGHWNEHNEEGKFFLDHTSEVWGVYVFNSASHTHCCELTPSYELHRIGVDFSPNEDWSELSEEKQERLHSILEDSEAASLPDNDVIYMHVSSVERIRERDSTLFRVVEVDSDTLEADDPRKAAVDEIRELFCTGCLLV